MIYITGDTHGYFGDSRLNLIRTLGKSDKLIVLGDFGYDWDATTKKHFNSIRHDCQILFVGGNHENYECLEHLPKKRKFKSIVGDFGNNTYYLKNGHMYTIEGKKFFVYGGALSVDRNQRVPYVSWWPQEIPSSKDFRKAQKTLERHSYKFDYFLAHTASTTITDQIRSMFVFKIYDPVSAHLQTLEDAITENKGEYKHFYFGHWHVNEGIDPTHTCLYKNVYNLTLDKQVYSGK